MPLRRRTMAQSSAYLSVPFLSVLPAHLTSCLPHDPPPSPVVCACDASEEEEGADGEGGCSQTP